MIEFYKIINNLTLPIMHYLLTKKNDFSNLKNFNEVKIGTNITNNFKLGCIATMATLTQAN